MHRPSGDVLRVEMRSNRNDPKDDHSANFFVPMELAPFLGTFFTALTQRLDAAGLLQPATDGGDSGFLTVRHVTVRQ